MFRMSLLAFAFLLPGCSPTEEPPAARAENAITASVSPLVAEPAHQKRLITLAADPWCPHNCEAGAKLEGYMVDIAREAFALAGFEVSYLNMSWARALQQAEDGHIDAVVGAFVGDATDFVFPAEPTGHSSTALYTRTDNPWAWNGIESLAGQTLLTINGYSYSPELDRYIDAHQDNPEQIWTISGPSPLNRAIELLEQRRSDVFPEDKYVMAWAIAHRDREVPLRMAAEIYRSPIYIAFSPANPNAPELAALLTSGTRKLRDSGRLDEILNAYGLARPD